MFFRRVRATGQHIFSPRTMKAVGFLFFSAVCEDKVVENQNHSGRNSVTDKENGHI